LLLLLAPSAGDGEDGRTTAMPVSPLILPLSVSLTSCPGCRALSSTTACHWSLLLLLPADCDGAAAAAAVEPPPLLQHRRARAAAAAESGSEGGPHIGG
jgi:hypothetical protein